MSTSRTGILLANFGGPRTPAEIPRVLEDLFSDPDIFQTPFGPLGQKALAKFITAVRTPKATKAYAGIGGASPLVAITGRQRDALAERLRARDCVSPLAIGMRYGEPALEAGLRELLDQGCKEVLLAPLYPHYSISTTGSTLNAMGRLVARIAPGLRWDALPSFPTHPGYIAALAETIAPLLHLWDADRLPANKVLLFSAHGLPLSFVQQGDPYPTQVRATATKVIEALGYQGAWMLTYQSRVGPVEWLKPYTDETIEQLADAGIEGIIAVPISFVADNLESLEEIDQEYRHLAWECGIHAFQTVPCLNDFPAFITALADLLLKRLMKPGPVPGPCTLPGRRPRPQLIGLSEYEQARRAGRLFDPAAHPITAPWWKSVRRAQRNGRRQA